MSFSLPALVSRPNPQGHPRREATVPAEAAVPGVQGRRAHPGYRHVAKSLRLAQWDAEGPVACPGRHSVWEPRGLRVLLYRHSVPQPPRQRVLCLEKNMPRRARPRIGATWRSLAPWDEKMRRPYRQGRKF